MLRLITIAIICTALLIPIAGFGRYVIGDGPLLIVLTFGLGYAVLPALLLRLWPSGNAVNVKSMQQALEDGELAINDYVVRAIAQIEELEDEGLHFLITTENGETLALSGQYLYGPVERRDFPSTRVRVFSNQLTGACYGIEPAGERIEEWPIYDSFTVEQVRSDFMIEDGKRYPQSIDEIIRTLGLQQATKSPAEPGFK